MKKATVRELRNHFARVSQWLEEGQPVQLTKRGKVIARILPVKPPQRAKVEWPDFVTRLNRIYQKRLLPDSQPLLDQVRRDR